MEMFSNSGYELMQRGMVPFSRCAHTHAPHPTGAEGDLGLPCLSGGSVAIAQTERRGILIVCMLFYLPVSAANSGGSAGEYAPPYQRPPQRPYTRPPQRSNLDFYRHAREHCRSYQVHSAYVDLTAMAWCIYFNFPNLQSTYPPNSRGTGSRLRGLIIIPGGDEGDMSMLSGAAVEASRGSLVFDHFNMHRPELNLPAIFLTCVCAWPV